MIYVSSDWHGCAIDTVKELFQKAGFSGYDYCFVLGDVIDRGEHGIELLQWLMMQDNIELLRGNHEEMMLANKFLFDEINNETIEKLNGAKLDAARIWLFNGAKPTIDSLKKLETVEREYIYEYISDTPLYEHIEINDKSYILTHSGLMNFDPQKKLTDYSSTELLWNRPKENCIYYQDRITVFGHTPTIRFGSKYKGKVMKTETWIDIDTGAVLGGTPMLLRLDDMREFYYGGS